MVEEESCYFCWHSAICLFVVLVCVVYARKICCQFKFAQVFFLSSVFVFYLSSFILLCNNEVLLVHPVCIFTLFLGATF